LKVDKMVVCSRVGSLDNETSKIAYSTIEELRKKEFDLPIWFIIPSDMHFLEQEVLEEFR